MDYHFRNDKFRDPVTSPRPDLVILDLRLPIVDGLTVLKKIKGEPGASPAPCGSCDVF